MCVEVGCVCVCMCACACVRVCKYSLLPTFFSPGTLGYIFMPFAQKSWKFKCLQEEIAGVVDKIFIT